MKTRSCESACESETTSGWNWKVIRGAKPEGEAHAGIKSISLWT